MRVHISEYPEWMKRTVDEMVKKKGIKNVWEMEMASKKIFQQPLGLKDELWDRTLVPFLVELEKLNKGTREWYK